MRPFLVVFGLFLAGLALSAQSFDAISIRTDTQSPFGQGIRGLQPGRFVAIGANVPEIAAIAFGVTRDRIVGGPDWVRSRRFNITATVSGEATRERVMPMLRQMLTDRFAMKSHREDRVMPVYAMTMARRDASFGPKLRRSGAECAPVTPPSAEERGGLPPPPPPPPPPPGGSGMRPLPEREAMLRCPSMFFPGGASARAVPISELTVLLTQFLDRPVVDRTNLTGEFDLDLVYQFELAPAGAGASASVPSVFAAMQEQLGLRLEAARAPRDVIVIDSISPPTEN